MLAYLIVACAAEDPSLRPTPAPPAQDPVASGPVVDPPAGEPRQPRPSMGGGLALDDEGQAWLSDPDSGDVLRLDTATGTPLATLRLGVDAIPNRIVVTATHLAVVVRGLGGVAVAKRDDLVPTVVPVCSEPRGITAVDDSTAWVACADGVLARLDLPTATVTTSIDVELDLRDVLPDGDLLKVSRFKAAELLTVDPATGAVLERAVPPTASFPAFAVSEELSPFSPFAAWRTVTHPEGGFLMVHLRGADGRIPLDEDTDGDSSPYGGSTNDFDCGGGIVHGTVTHFGDDGTIVTSGPILFDGIPVDVAVDEHGTIRLATLGVAGPGATTTAVTLQPSAFQPRSCATVTAAAGAPGAPHGDGVVARPGGGFVYAHRFPLGIDGTPLNDANPTVGFDRFHRSTVAGLSCASCHMEGHEDGRVWAFKGDGLRRTQELGGGGISASAPFHWDGTLDTLGSLMAEVHQRRMGGGESTVEDVADVAAFLDSIPAQRPPAVRDPALVAEGDALFHDPAVGCADCHTDPPPVLGFEVGTSYRPLQVPRLVGVAYRGPWIHDGCAATLRDRFDPECGGDAHGDVDGLGERELDALTAWLASR